MKSSTASAPIESVLPIPPTVCIQTGPMPGSNSTVGDRSKGFLNIKSVSHSVCPRLNRVVTPVSITSQFLMGVNSTEADGPKLERAPFNPHSPAPPSSTTAKGSLSSARVAPANSRAAMNAINTFQRCFDMTAILSGFRTGSPGLKGGPVTDSSDRQEGLWRTFQEDGVGLYERARRSRRNRDK